MKLRNVGLFTTTRADFGVNEPLARRMALSSQLRPRLFVGGAHYAGLLGTTLSEVEKSGLPVADTFEYLQEGPSSPERIVRDMATEMSQLAEIFTRHRLDVVCLTGDRYELLPIAFAALVFRVPIVHMYGGERSEGVIDEQVRHMLTKAAQFHLVSCADHAVVVENMGEDPDRVFVVGELATDLMATNIAPAKASLYAPLALDPDRPLVLLTYHPVTLGTGISGADQIASVLRAMRRVEVQVLITAPNLEVGTDEILRIIHREVESNDQFRYTGSLGVERYHSLLQHCSAVVGNSSSGLLEAPFFRTPTVNIGDRQQGRIRHPSVVDASYDEDAIVAALELALSDEFRKGISSMQYKLGDGRCADRVVDILEKLPLGLASVRKRLF